MSGLRVWVWIDKIKFSQCSFLSLYNDYWHGFGICSWCSRVLWQAVTLWLVNRGWQCVRADRSSSYVTGRVPHDMRTTRSDLDKQAKKNRESNLGFAAEHRRLRRLWRYGLQRGASVSTHWLPEEDMGQEVPTLIICPSIYLSNLVPLSRIKWDIYIFIKKCISFVHWSSFVIFHYVLGWVYEKYTTLCGFMSKHWQFECSFAGRKHEKCGKLIRNV